MRNSYVPGILVVFISLLCSPLHGQSMSYPVVGTGVTDFYSNTSTIEEPLPGEIFFGQNGNYPGNVPSYTDNHDGTITDNVTGLMWQQDMGSKITWFDAFTKASTMTLGGYDDWRVPTIKELYSLILFTGRVNGTVPYEMFIDSGYFIQPLGDTEVGERLIDAQTWSSTQYRSTTMNGDTTVFGVNFLDGRIKGYPKYEPGSSNTIQRLMYFRMVRGNPDYGQNDFTGNGDGTITDNATGLMWQQADDGISRDWQTALTYAENMQLAGYDDWRLPDAKELQSIVDYSRCPDVTGSAALDPVFSITGITDPEGNPGQYPYFWTSTTHLDGNNPYSPAVYIAFGEAQGKMNNTLMDVHGAGAQRSDPKTGDEADYPDFFGPQGDVRYVFNHVRCVRNVNDATGKSLPLHDRITVISNPATGICLIRNTRLTEKMDVQVFDISGKFVNSYHHNHCEGMEINLSSCHAGMYILYIRTENGTKVQSIIKW